MQSGANGGKALITFAVDCAPSSDPGACAVCVRGASGGQTDWPDVVREGDRRGELQQADVVVLRLGVIVGVVGDLAHTSRHLVWVPQLLVAASEVHGHISHVGAREKTSWF